MAWLNVAKIIDVTQAEGPGLRTAIWVQGCLKRCVGCCNGQFLKIQPADVYDSKMIIEQIAQNQQQYGIEGVTLLGGEPFLQAEGLADVAQACRKMGLSVMVFSGYQLEELDDARFKGASQLLKVTDVLVDGEYQQALIENVRNWVGSTNQRFHYFTDFYDVSIETRSLTVTNEWRIDAQGNILGNGLPFILKANN
jgi:anaerobic ribonucleoside-triphosphate reductase activating protein